MPSTYTTNLRIEKQANGENSATWGTKTNTSFDLFEQAISGVATVDYASDANKTLTTNNAASDEARNMVLNVTSSVSLTATRELVVPAVDKIYIIKNATTGSQSITVKTSGGSGVTIPNGVATIVYCDATNVLQAMTSSPAAFYFAAGAEATPSLTTTGDSNTGIWFPAADTVAVSTGGTERIRIDSSGDVGIGATPSVAGVILTVVGGQAQLSPGTTAQPGFRVGQEVGYAQLVGINNDNDTYNGLKFYAGAVAALTVETTGAVVIGTDGSAGPLTLSATDGTNEGGQMQLNGAGSYDDWAIDSYQNDLRILTNSANTNTVQIANSGAGSININCNGGIFVGSDVAGLGYTTGAGGAVTQITSKSTTVELNTPTGQITTHNENLAAGGSVRFQVNNSLVASADVIILNVQNVSAVRYEAHISGVGGGSFGVSLTNVTGGDLAEAVVLNFAIIKGSTS